VDHLEVDQAGVKNALDLFGERILTVELYVHKLRLHKKLWNFDAVALTIIYWATSELEEDIVSFGKRANDKIFAVKPVELGLAPRHPTDCVIAPVILFVFHL
jgi:hypothetical protein